MDFAAKGGIVGPQTPVVRGIDTVVVSAGSRATSPQGGRKRPPQLHDAATMVAVPLRSPVAVTASASPLHHSEVEAGVVAVPVQETPRHSGSSIPQQKQQQQQQQLEQQPAQQQAPKSAAAATAAHAPRQTVPVTCASQQSPRPSAAAALLGTPVVHDQRPPLRSRAASSPSLEHVVPVHVSPVRGAATPAWPRQQLEPVMVHAASIAVPLSAVSVSSIPPSLSRVDAHASAPNLLAATAPEPVAAGAASWLPTRGPPRPGEEHKQQPRQPRQSGGANVPPRARRTSLSPEPGQAKPGAVKPGMCLAQWSAAGHAGPRAGPQPRASPSPRPRMRPRSTLRAIEETNSEADGLLESSNGALTKATSEDEDHVDFGHDEKKCHVTVEAVVTQQPCASASQATPPRRVLFGHGNQQDASNGHGVGWRQDQAFEGLSPFLADLLDAECDLDEATCGTTASIGRLLGGGIAGCGAAGCTLPLMGLAASGWVNQENHLVMSLGPQQVFIAVFDGHGGEGPIAARRARFLFEQQAPSTCGGLSGVAVARGMFELFQHVHKVLTNDEGLVGTICGVAVAAATIDMAGQTATTAHVGDCRLLAAAGNGNVIFESTQHFAEPDAAAIASGCRAGQQIELSGLSARCSTPPRGIGAAGRGPWAMHPLGDWKEAALGVRATPSIGQDLPLGPGGVLLAATGAVWERLPCQALLKQAAAADTPEAGALAVVQQARHLRRFHGDAGAANLLAVVVRVSGEW